MWKQKHKQMLIIGIYGGTGSGKTTIVEQIVSEFPSSEIQVLSQDSYYKDNSNISFEERCALNFDHPDAIDFKLLYQHVFAHLRRIGSDRDYRCDPVGNQNR